MFWRRPAGDYQGMGDEMTIDRELIEDIESRLGIVAHNLFCVSGHMQIIGWANKDFERSRIEKDFERSRIELEKAFKSWLTLRVKLQAAGVVSNVGG